MQQGDRRLVVVPVADSDWKVVGHMDMVSAFSSVWEGESINRSAQANGNDGSQEGTVIGVSDSATRPFVAAVTGRCE